MDISSISTYSLKIALRLRVCCCRFTVAKMHSRIYTPPPSAAAFLVATADGFEVIVGIKAWVAALDAFDRTPEVNRQLLAAVAKPE